MNSGDFREPELVSGFASRPILRGICRYGPNSTPLILNILQPQLPARRRGDVHNRADYAPDVLPPSAWRVWRVLADHQGRDRCACPASVGLGLLLIVDGDLPKSNPRPIWTAPKPAIAGAPGKKSCMLLM